MNEFYDHEDMTEVSIALNIIRLLITAGRAAKAWRSRRRGRPAQ
jgi:hypothetical protein